MKEEQINKNTIQNQVGRNSAEDVLQLRELLDMFLKNWHWFLFSVLLCVTIAFFYLKTKPFIYQRQAVLLVKDNNGGSTGHRAAIGNEALMQLNGVMVGSSVKNEVYILQSHQLMKEVVRKLHLDVSYSLKQRFQNVSLYDVKPFEIQFTGDTTIISAFQVKVLNDRECRISNVQTREGNLSFEKTIRFGQGVKSPIGDFTVIPNPKNLKDFQDKTILITHLDVETAANVVSGRISTGEIDRESTLIRIGCTDTNIRRAEDILTALLDAYKQSIIDDKNMLAQSTADFIDERIQLISGELSEVEGDLARFKQSNNLVDLSQNAQAYLQQSTAARQRTIQLQAQQATVNYLLDYLKSSSTGNDLIPTLGGLTDAAIQTQIGKYNEIMLQRNRLVENSSENSGTIRELDSNLAQMRQAIIASMQGFANSVDLQMRQAHREEAALKGSLSSVPQKEKQVIDIARQQSIKETLYTYLLNKREETALQLAITEANIRIVEQPYGSLAPIAPRKLVITCAAALIGFILPFIVFYFVSLLNMGVRGRKDIEAYTTIPVIGEIPHIKGDFDESQIVVENQNNDAVSEAFRILRFNMNFANKDARVIMFTSTMSGEGKTFISRNFAYTLSLLGKHVVLIDADIRKRTQSKLYGVSRREGLTSYLSGSVEDPFELIIRGSEKGSVDVIPAGFVPPNPAELLMSDRLEKLIEKLQETYDYVIVDNVPAQAVADAGIVNRVADLTIYVVRDRKLDRRYLPELERLYNDGLFNNLWILINDSRIENKKYGYGYGIYVYGKKKK